MNIAHGVPVLCACLFAAGCAQPPRPSALFEVNGDSIPAALAVTAADAARGREIAFGRDGNCLLCHRVPDSGGRPMGNLAPPLDGVASRLDAGQIRLRIADPARVNRATIMPRYFALDGLQQVASPFRGATSCPRHRSKMWSRICLRCDDGERIGPARARRRRRSRSLSLVFPLIPR